MIWKKEPLCPMQPYWRFDMCQFRQEMYRQQGISHFYTYGLDAGRLLRIVPDGCIDLVFEYYHGEMKSYARGTSLEYSVEMHAHDAEVFGVCFMPGVQPELLNVTMRDLLKHKLPLEGVLKGEQDWLNDMAHEPDFHRRIRIFTEHYAKWEQQRPEPYSKKGLVCTIQNLACDTDGKIKVQEMQEQTGYTTRYLNKVFTEEMGFSPKTFCKIIRFQRALELLSRGNDEKMTDVAEALGYYDQPQFIRDFTRCAGITPSRYRRIAKNFDYRERIQETRSGAET